MEAGASASSSSSLQQPSTIIALPTEDDIYICLESALQRTHGDILSHCGRLRHQLEGAKMARLQRVALSRASAQYAQRMIPTMLRHALTVQRRRTELTTALHRAAKQLLSGRTLSNSNGNTNTNNNNNSESVCRNVEVVMGLIRGLWEDEADTTSMRIPVCPSKRVFKEFLTEAVTRQKLHESLAVQLEAMEEKGNNNNSNGSAQDGSPDCLVQSIQLLDKMMERSSSSSAAVEVEIDNEDCTDIDNNDDKHTYVRVPFIVSMEQYCCDAPWAVTHYEENKKQKKGKESDEGAESDVPFGMWMSPLLPSLSASPTKPSPTTAFTDNFNRNNGKGVEEEADVELSAIDAKQESTRRVVQHVSSSVQASWSGLLTDSLIQSLVAHRQQQKATPHTGAAEENLVEEEEEEERKIRSFVDAVTIAVTVDVSSRVLGQQIATDLLLDSEDAMVFDGYRRVQLTAVKLTPEEKHSDDAAGGNTQDNNNRSSGTTSPTSLSDGVTPFTVFNLPGMETLFYGVAYTLGAALLVDYGNSTPAGVPSAPIDVDADCEESETQHHAMLSAWSRLAGLQGATTRSRQHRRTPCSVAADLACAQRLWAYLWEHVIRVIAPPHDEVLDQAAAAAAAVTTSATTPSSKCVAIHQSVADEWLQAIVQHTMRYALSQASIWDVASHDVDDHNELYMGNDARETAWMKAMADRVHRETRQLWQFL